MHPVRIAVVCMGFFLSLSSWAQTPQAAPHLAPSVPALPTDEKTPVPAAAHALEPGDLEAFFDGIIPLQMERSDIAGASVLVMKDGNVLLKKGYGYADEKKRRPSIRRPRSFDWLRFRSCSHGFRSCSLWSRASWTWTRM